ncbi:hypothetical protein WH52_10550 [Tenacibaculum holothuriorum]|uniref:DUF4407 domain-containing protein n=1 Tax=Tenacibaculum holothuriorum TaxID=1635173 RepID=A0A1Y2PBI4_9FLAO|nr:DUF4407 domain-containing protein [Tenacibaculum holothuriorum]OSY87540.1 hypothetical protein WH52_10550 [Tenacibaculum holothuriorum]
MIKQFFLLCSGVDQDLIKDCSNGEQNKYAGIGATVFFTALMAIIACSYALYTVFDNIYSSIFFGLLWGLLIFNLDRFIVSTIKKRDSKRQEILQVIPRLLLAMIIAVVISKPLELKIFEKEINQVLLEEKNQMTLNNKTQIAQQFTPEIQQLNSEITTLKEEITDKENDVNALYETYIAEAEGRKGTKLLGKGPVYKEKREKHDAALKELSELKAANAEKIKDKEASIVKLTEQQKVAETKTQPIISNFDGLMARVNTLNKLPWLPSFFIFLLFLAIETAPIFAKLISSKSEYDYKLENQESLVKTWIQQQVHQREAILQTDIDLNDKIYSDLKTEEEIYNYKQKMARNLLKLQADSFYKNQQKIL